MSYIGNEPIVSATRTITEVTATAGQTVFTANGGYTVGYIDVFLNGAQLQTVDFTATNGSSITLTEAAQVGDVIRLVAWGTFQSANLNGAGLVDGTVTQAKLATGVAGTGPAFSAYQSTLQTLATGVATKIQFQTENFDTASCFDNTTNYRFTPNVAGYYQINSTITAVLNVNNQPLFVQIFKNGVNITWGQAMGSTTAYPTVTVSSLIYMNGTTDYVEIYGLHSNPSSVATIAQSEYNSFSASLVRSA